MTNTRPHYLYSDVVNSIKGVKASIEAMTGLLDGTIAIATNTSEFGIYSADTDTWTWIGSSVSGSAIFQRIQTSSLSMINGESLIVLDYIDLESYDLVMVGDSALEIHNG